MFKPFLLLAIVFTLINSSKEDSFLIEGNQKNIVQNQEANFKNILEKALSIDDNLEQYKKNTALDINIDPDNIDPDINTENFAYECNEIFNLAMINLDRFYDRDKNLVKASVDFQGVQSDITSNYYFLNNSLYVSKRTVQYEKARWHDGFDEQAYEEIKNEFYISNGQMLKWIENGKENSFNNDEIIQKTAEILHDADIYKNYP